MRDTETKTEELKSLRQVIPPPPPQTSNVSTQTPPRPTSPTYAGAAARAAGPPEAASAKGKEREGRTPPPTRDSENPDRIILEKEVDFERSRSVDTPEGPPPETRTPPQGTTRKGTDLERNPPEWAPIITTFTTSPNRSLARGPNKVQAGAMAPMDGGRKLANRTRDPGNSLVDTRA